MKRERMTFEQHQQVAQLLFSMRQTLHIVLNQISGRVPTTRTNRLIRIEESIDMLRAQLEDILFKHYHKDPRTSLSIYYPGVSTPQRLPILPEGMEEG